MSLTWETEPLMFAYVRVTYDVQLMIKLENGTYLILASSLPLFCLLSCSCSWLCSNHLCLSLVGNSNSQPSKKWHNFMFDMSDRYILNWYFSLSCLRIPYWPLWINYATWLKSETVCQQFLASSIGCFTFSSGLSFELLLSLFVLTLHLVVKKLGADHWFNWLDK